MAGRILLAATPIGNVGDASARLWTALQEADVIAAEDTRSLRDLARRGGIEITARVLAMHEHNEDHAAPSLVKLAADGALVVVVSDAGMPTVSDPGLRLVQAAIAAGVSIEVLPGASAPLVALALSGLPTDRFCFEGFPSRKSGERLRSFQALGHESRTMIFFEAPHRIHETLIAMAEAFGDDRAASVSRELTKTHEETVRGTLGELAAWAQSQVRGEIVIVVAGRPPAAPPFEAVLAEALSRITTGERAKDVCSELAATTGIAGRDLYAAVIAARDTA